jgi:hypothetical protein
MAAAGRWVISDQARKVGGGWAIGVTAREEISDVRRVGRADGDRFGGGSCRLGFAEADRNRGDTM